MNSADDKGKKIDTAAQNTALQETALQEHERLQRAQQRSRIVGLSGRDIVARHLISGIEKKISDFFNFPTSFNRPVRTKNDEKRSLKRPQKRLNLLRLREYPIIWTSNSNTFELFGSLRSFSIRKGFGYITPDPDNDIGYQSGEILIQTNCFKSSGYQTALEGAKIHCEAIHGIHGMEAISILDMDTRTARHPSQYPISKSLTIRPESDWERAIVQWFDIDRGFGFLRLAKDSSDIFVHMETLQRYGLLYLDIGQEVEVRWGRNRFGFVAVQLRPYGFWPGAAVSH